jgi:hypothetical protein
VIKLIGFQSKIYCLNLFCQHAPQTYKGFAKIFMSLTTIYKYNIDILINIIKNNPNKPRLLKPITTIEKRIYGTIYNSLYAIEKSKSNFTRIYSLKNITWSYNFINKRNAIKDIIKNGLQIVIIRATKKKKTRLVNYKIRIIQQI